jgi:hypothetical protein
MRAIRLQDSPTLPPKPAADAGRAVLWVYVLGEPGFVYRDMDYLVNAEVIDQHVKRFDLLCGRGYRPPLAVQHPDGIHDLTTMEDLRNLPAGLRAGDILVVRRWTVDGKEALIAAVSPAMPAAQVERAVSLGQLKYFSPGLGPVQTDEGDVLSLVLKELSIVTAPHQKTAPTHVLGQEQGGPPMEPENDAAPDYKAMMAQMAECMKRMEAMEAKMQAMEKPAEEEPPAEEPVNMAESAALVALQAEVAALREANFLATVPQTITLTLGEKDRDILTQLHRVSPDLAKKLVGKARPGAAPAAPPIGNEGAPAQPSDPAALYQVCLSEAKGDAVQAHNLYSARRRAQLGA